jgi:hypothetical protein
MIPFKAMMTREVKPEATKEPEVDMADGEDEMELYSVVSDLERATDGQLRRIFGEMKFNHLNRIQRLLDELRDVPNY